MDVRTLSGLRARRWRLRLEARFGQWRLDRELAGGCSAESDELHSLRAQLLADRATRRKFAVALRLLVADAGDPRSRPSSAPLRRDAVLACREGLLGLADRLELAGPVDPCGVARVRLLLTDPAGPLYNPAPERPLGEVVWWIADGLQPVPPPHLTHDSRR